MNIIKQSLAAVVLSISIVSCGESQVKTVTTKQAESIGHTYAMEKMKVKDLSKYSQATFAAGCFWHEETLFESIKGVKEVISGYAGGNTKNPTYELIEEGTTGHAETVNVYYDSTEVSYATLLKVYFEGEEDPTQVNGQGPDRGTQYRSIIFYRNASEKALASDYINKMNASKKYSRPVAAQVVPMGTFWRAEDYHQDYIDTHSGESYVSNVCIPEITKFQAKYPELIKPGHSFVNNH